MSGYMMQRAQSIIPSACLQPRYIRLKVPAKFYPKFLIDFKSHSDVL